MRILITQKIDADATANGPFRVDRISKKLQSLTEPISSTQRSLDKGMRGEGGSTITVPIRTIEHIVGDALRPRQLIIRQTK